MSSQQNPILERLLELHVRRRRLSFLLEELRDLHQPTDGLERMLEDHRREATELLAELEVIRHTQPG